MDNYLAFISEINRIYWGSRILSIVFLFSVIIIISLEKEFWKRILFFWYTVIVMGCIYTPVSIKIGEILWKGNWAYFCRLFSVLPIFFCIAYAFVLVLENSKKYTKLILLLAFCIGLYFYGDNFYTFPGVTTAANHEKLPADVIEICDAVHSDKEDVTIAVPTAISPYIRQYDDSIFMPYGRLKKGPNSISILLDSAEIDQDTAKKILKKMVKKSCDYFVLTRTDMNELVFYDMGYEPICVTDTYLVFDMHGHKRTHKEYNDAGKIIEKQYYNDKNKLSNGKKRGYAVIKYEYNDVGKKSVATYYDKKGNIVKTKKYEN